MGKWHPSRIESSAGNGVPDIAFGIPRLNGFIELKYRDEWPKKATTKVKVPLRPEQKHWIKNRQEIAGNVWVLFRIADDFFLISGTQALENMEEGWTKDEWYTKYAFSGYWQKRIDFEELYQYLRAGC